MGNYGFDLVSWYTLKEWIDTREKMLAIRRDIKFDPEFALSLMEKFEVKNTCNK